MRPSGFKPPGWRVPSGEPQQERARLRATQLALYGGHPQKERDPVKEDFLQYKEHPRRWEQEIKCGKGRNKTRIIWREADGTRGGRFAKKPTPEEKIAERLLTGIVEPGFYKRRRRKNKRPRA